ETCRIWTFAKGTEWRCWIGYLFKERPDLASGREAGYQVPFPAYFEVFASCLRLLNELHKRVCDCQFLARLGVGKYEVLSLLDHLDLPEFGPAPEGAYGVPRRKTGDANVVVPGDSRHDSDPS